MPIRKNLEFWPVTIPLAIDYYSSHSPSSIDEDNLVAALEQADRVHRVDIFASHTLLRKVATVMQKSFPVLTHLVLKWDHEDMEFTTANSPVLPKGFLNESAPCLQDLCLESFLLPEVPTFLLSSHILVTLKLETMFQDSFVSPKAMAGWLDGMTRLKTLLISFYYADTDLFAFDQERTRSDLKLRITLPTLTHFHYIGHSGYLESLLAQIDAPLLIRLGITYHWNHFQASQLSRFIGHIENFNQFNRAEASFEHGVTVEFDYLHRKGLQASLSIFLPKLEYLLGQEILDTALGKLFTTFSNVNHLSVDVSAIVYTIDNDQGTGEWLQFFRLFPAVEVLQLSGVLGDDAVSSLEDNAEYSEEMLTDILPVLDTIWLSDVRGKEPKVGSMMLQQFLSLRQRSGHPVTIVNTQEELEEKLEKLESHRDGQENVL